MRGLLRLTACLAGALVAAAACTRPATAAPAPPWYDGGAGAPTTVDFKSVAGFRTTSGDDVLVAAGRDTALKQAVIYSRVGGVWTQDPIAGSLNGIAYDSCLKSVALTPHAAWAVGSQGGGCPDSASSTGNALIVALPGGGGALAAGANTWQIVQDQSNTMGTLRSIALSGSGGFIASAAGAVYPVQNAGSVPADMGAGPTGLGFTPSAKAIDGVAAYGPAAGFAVGQSNPAGVSIYTLGSDAKAANADPAQGELAQVAALGSSAAIAVDSGSCPSGGSAPGYWYARGTLWQRDGSGPFPAGGQFNGVHMAGSTVTATEAIAGEAPDAGAATCHGVVWYRTGDPASTGGWTSSEGQSALGSPLNGVAVIDRFDMWAVGDQGNVVHYFNPPPPPPPPAPAGGQQAQSTSGSSSTSSAPKSTSSTWTTPQIIVDQPPPKRQPGQRGPARRLLSHVKVRVLPGRLVVRFLLSGWARVRMEPRTAGRLVGAARTRVLGAGRRRMVVTYRGSRPPAQLRIVARPASRPRRNACSRKKGNRGGHCAQAKAH